MSTRFAVILNAGSGKSATNITELRALFVARGIDATVVSPKTGDDVSELAGSLVQSGYKIIVAAGGDGTVSAVASALACSETVMGVLPLGSLNHFAKDAGIPLTLAEAVSNLVDGRVMKVDVGDVNGRIFINNISLGLYPAFVQARGEVRRQSRLARWYTIFKAAMSVLSRLPILRARVIIDAKSLTRITPVVFIGNNEYGLEGASIGCRTRLNGGCLSIIMTQRRGSWGLIRLVARAALGTLRGAKDLDVLLGQEIEVRTKGWRKMLAIDGEVTNEMKRPLQCAVRPVALRVLVPSQTNTNHQQ